jgi:glycosyltransferase involved in cell wall biosynthesis
VAAAGAGLVVPPAAGPLAAAALRFVGDAELAARCGANGRALAWTRLSWDQAAAGLERMYQQVVAEAGPAAAAAAPPGRGEPGPARSPSCPQTQA